MPGFIKTNRDEKKWEKAKSAVQESNDKGEANFTDRDLALANHIYQNTKSGSQRFKRLRDRTKRGKA